MTKKARFKKGTNDADNNGKKGGSLPALPIAEQYMSDGNNVAVEGGEFPVLVLENGMRIVGNKGQTIEALIEQAQGRGHL